jgi:hypothetical protein
MSEIVNKVAGSGLIQFDPADFFKGVRFSELDIAPWLFEGVMLREKLFREHLANHQWDKYSSSAVAVYCSGDALIQNWAWMLVSAHLQGHAGHVLFCKPDEAHHRFAMQRLEDLNVDAYKDGRVIIKGCSEFELAPELYGRLVQKLAPVALSIMFGEPCSTVPVWKARKKAGV